MTLTVKASELKAGDVVNDGRVVLDVRPREDSFRADVIVVTVPDVFRSEGINRWALDHDQAVTIERSEPPQPYKKIGELMGLSGNLIVTNDGQ